jgi:hypothetical protein
MSLNLRINYRENSITYGKALRGKELILSKNGAHEENSTILHQRFSNILEHEITIQCRKLGLITFDGKIGKFIDDIARK